MIYLYTSIYNTYIYLSVPLSSFFVFLLHPNLKAKADERPLESESAPGFFLHGSPDPLSPPAALEAQLVVIVQRSFETPWVAIQHYMNKS